MQKRLRKWSERDDTNSFPPRLRQNGGLSGCPGRDGPHIPAFAAADSKILRFIAQSDLRVLDPIWTTAYITRNHGYMVFDTLFALDDKFVAHPQMVRDYSVSEDRLLYNFTLRDGLKFHDGELVRHRLRRVPGPLDGARRAWSDLGHGTGGNAARRRRRVLHPAQKAVSDAD